MRRKWSLAAVFVLLMLPENAVACETRAAEVRSGFIPAEEFLSLNEQEQTLFVTGFVGAYLTLPVLGGDSDCSEKLWRCIEIRTNSQLAAVVAKYVRDHPEDWHLKMNLVTYSAISELCNLGES